jgi:phytol kinase
MMWSDVIGALFLLAYYLVVCTLLPTLLKAFTGAPRELVRKIQHLGYSLSIFLLIKLFSSWYAAVTAAFVLVLVAYPALLILEKLPLYRELFVDRRAKGGELRMQLLLVQFSFGLLLFLFWGILGTDWRYLIPVAVMAWGFGDAAAALVGKAFGRRLIISRFIDGPKTYAGTAAMFLAATAAIFLTLLIYAGKPWHFSLLIAVIVSPACTLVELFSRRGIDTLTVPLTAAALMLPLIHLLSLFGWMI